MASDEHITQLLQNPQVRQMVRSLLSQMKGGKTTDVNRLLSELTSSGLGGQAQSWIGIEDNEPITGEQLQESLGTNAMTQVAEKVGIAPEAAANELANVLPSLVDSLSPHGELPSAPVQQEQLMKLLGTPES